MAWTEKARATAVVETAARMRSARRCRVYSRSSERATRVVSAGPAGSWMASSSTPGRLSSAGARTSGVEGMSPLPLLACFLLLGGLILALLYALRRGIQEQQELDALSDIVEYEDEDEKQP